MAVNRSALISPYTRRWFLAISLTTLIAFVCVRYFALPRFFAVQTVAYADMLAALLDKFIVAIVAAVSVSSVLLWLQPASFAKAVVEVVNSFELKRELNNAYENISDFAYVGHMAKWTRSVTMERLAFHAKSNNSRINVKIVILDPSSSDCARFFLDYYRRFGKTKKNKSLLLNDYRIELFSTIVALVAWQTEEPLLNIRLALSDKVSLFRIDLYNKFVVVTQANPLAPAMKYAADSLFYISYREEVTMKFDQSKELPIVESRLLFDDLSSNTVLGVLQAVGCETAGLTPEDVDKIVETAKKRKSPY